MYTEHEVALLLGVRVSQVRRWRDGYLATGRRVGPPFRIEDGRVCYPDDALHAWLTGAATD